LLLVREAFGRRSALLFGLLWILAPVAFQKVALLNLGIHYQALLFQFLLAWYGLRILNGDSRRALACGLVGGFGLFYNFQLAPLIGLLGLAFLVRRSLDLTAWVRLVLGFLLGALPLGLMALEVGGQVLDIHGQELGEASTITVGFGEVLRSLGAYLGPRGWLQLGLLIGLPLGIWSWVPEHRRLAYRRLLAYLLLFALIVPASGFLTAGFSSFFGAMRYAPLYGFAVVLSAGALGMLLEARGGQRLAGLGLTVLLLSLGLSSSLSAQREGQAPDLASGLERVASMGGRDFAGYLAKVAERLELPDVEQLRVFAAIEGVPRHELYPAAAEAVYRSSKRPLSELLPELVEVDPEGWPDFLLGFGAWVTRGQGDQLVNAIRKARRQVDKVLAAGQDHDPVRLRQLLQEAIGRHGMGSYPHVRNLEDELEQMLRDNLPPRLYHGFGQRCLRRFLQEPWLLDELLAGRPEQVQRWVRDGFADAEARRRVER
jgi:hypothetical protein